MPDQLFDLFDSVARELDREADHVVPAASPETVRHDVESRHRRRTVVVVAVVLLMTLAVASALYAKVFRTAATPNWATNPSGAPSTTGASKPPQSPATVMHLTSPLRIKTASDLDGIAWLSFRAGRSWPVSCNESALPQGAATTSTSL